MKTTINLILFLALAWNTANAQVGIGTTSPDASAVLDVESTTKGFLPPRMNTTERDAISSPTPGLTIYNTEVNCLQWYNGTAWYDRCEGGLTPGALSDCSTSGFIPPFLPTDETIVKDVTNPVTGDTWMDRNLGAYTADRTPSASYSNGGTDCWAYGNLYQWGRTNDGHEDRTSNTIAGPVAAGSEGSDFITVGTDWLTTPDDDRWNANETAGGSVVKTVNDPCPAGYRVPTQAELETERNSWTQSPINSTDNREGAITSPLKLPVAGIRSYSTGGLSSVGSNGGYWSSTVADASARRLGFGSSAVFMDTGNRAFGISVRCLKD